MEKDYCLCPLCGHKATTLVQHIHNTHFYTTEQFKKEFPDSPLQSKWFISRANRENHLTKKGKESLSARMTENNPMKKIETRKKVSGTRKKLYKNDIEFRERMLEIKEKYMDNAIKDKGNQFKVPGWGISGKLHDIYFRSTNELKFLIWAKKQNTFSKIKSNIKITYGKLYFYCDFQIDDVFYEIKDKDYPQDRREQNQYQLIELMKIDGYNVHLLTKKSDIIKSISYYDILEEYSKGYIVFAQNTEHYNLVKRLKEEVNANK